MTESSHSLRDTLKIHFLVLIWGFTAILGMLIELPSVEVVFFRTLLASLGLGVLVYFKKRSFRLRRRDAMRIMGVGALIAAHWIFFFAAARVSNISICLAGMATASLWTSFIEPVMFKRRLRIHEVLLGLMIILGLYVIFRFEFNHSLGLIFAMISAFLAALFSVINAKITKNFNHTVITFYEMLGANISILLFFPFYSLFIVKQPLSLSPSLMDWFYLLILALVCTVYAYSQWVELMKRMTAYATNLIVNLEPVYGIILAVLIFGDKEKMNTGFYMGTLIILLSVFSYPVISRIVRKIK